MKRIIPFFLLYLVLLPVTVASPAPPAIQLAVTLDGDINVSEYLVSEKLDGVRGRWTGELLLTRGGHRIQAPAWFTSGWPRVAMDGELWIARGRFEDVSGIVRSTGAGDDAWRTVRFMVFDLPAFDAPFAERAARIRELLEDTGVAWLQPVEQFRVAGRDELDALLADTVAGGGEGLMLHHQDARYRVGRSRDLIKVKLHDDAEARVVGYTEGRGKYAGSVGALLLERPDGVRFRVGSGLDDADRADPPPIGSWITYRYTGLTANGLPRFPRFVRIRNVRPPADPR